MQVNYSQFFQIGRSGYINAKNSQGQNGYHQYADSRNTGRAGSAQDAREKRRLLSEGRQAEQYGSASADGKRTYQGGLQSGIVNDSVNYASTVRENRTRAKDTSLKLKRLRYDFKSISSQILRSKTSNSAKQAAAKARREVVRLKRLRQNGEYDSEEVQSAIQHAQAMERVAKKKARHLLEEELAKTGGPCLGELEDKELSGEEMEESEEVSGAREGMAGEAVWAGEGQRCGGGQSPDLNFAELQESLEQSSVPSSETLEQMDALLEKLEQASLSESLGAEMMESVSASMDDMWDSLQDLLEEMGLEDLAGDLTGASGGDMDPADLKMMKMKHRLKEMKEMAEADSEYLKALFDRLAKESAVAAGGTAMSGSSAGSPSGGIALGGGVSAPAASGGLAGGNGGDAPAVAFGPALTGGSPFSGSAAGGGMAAPVSGGIDISL